LRSEALERLVDTSHAMTRETLQETLDSLLVKRLITISEGVLLDESIASHQRLVETLKSVIAAEWTQFMESS
jgi:hypothetical protein